MLIQNSIVDGVVSTSPDGFPKISMYIQPDEEERKYLLDVLKIDEYTYHSAMDPDETPRIEFDDNYTAIIIKAPTALPEGDDFTFRVSTFGGFFFPSGNIVTCSSIMPPFYRLPGGRDGTRFEKLKTPQDVMLRSLSQVIRMFEIYLRLINTCRDQLKEKMNRSPENKNLMRMSDLREGLVYYIDALRGNGHLIERIRTAAGKLDFSPENMELLEDLAIENQQFLDQAQVSTQVLTELMDTWTSIINNNLSFIMKNMNSLVIAITIPSFFTGFGGMSEFTAFVSPYLAWYISYPLFLVCMAVISIFVYKLVQHFYKT